MDKLNFTITEYHIEDNGQLAESGGEYVYNNVSHELALEDLHCIHKLPDTPYMSTPGCNSIVSSKDGRLFWALEEFDVLQGRVDEIVDRSCEEVARG